jgi:nitrate reductase delta subunit
MTEQQRTILAIASRVLSYPEDEFPGEQTMILACIEENMEPGQLRKAIVSAVASLFKTPLKELRQCYVETFDMKEKMGLYLTAHELGDSRKRGLALIELQNLIREAGFEHAGGELADYIPMLYELLAVTPENGRMESLKQRLAVATIRIRDHLYDENPYKPIFSLLMDAVFEEPSAQEIQKFDLYREKPDLEPLPYPLMYYQA